MNQSWEYITTLSDLKQVKNHLLEYVKLPKAKLGLDLETSSTVEGKFPRPIPINDNEFGCYVTTMQIGVDPEVSDKQFLIDCRKFDRDDILEFKPLLENNMILGHGLKYDYGVLKQLYGIDLGKEVGGHRKLRDTQLVSQALHAGESMAHNLGSLYGKFLPYGWFKDFTGMSFSKYEEFKEKLQISDWSRELTLDQLRYASDDVRLIFYLYKAQLEALDAYKDEYEKGMPSGRGIVEVIKLECDLIPIYADMEMRGIQFDAEYHKNEVLPMLQRKKEEAEMELAKWFTYETSKGRGRFKVITTHPMNCKSPKQIKENLATLGIVVPNTEEETLLEHIEEHEVVKWIVQCKQADSKLTKYGPKMLEWTNPHTGRIYPSWFQMGAEGGTIRTGRSSCKDPPMQTIPNNEENICGLGKGAAELFRKSFISRPGYILIDADYSQIEPRLTAEVCNEESMIFEFQRSREVDTHSLAAKLAFSLDYLPDKRIPEQNVFRKAGKEVNLGSTYGMGVNKLSQKITKATGDVCTVERASEIRKEYNANLPGINQVKREVEMLFRRKADHYEGLSYFKGHKPLGVPHTQFGRVRRFCLSSEMEDIAREDPDKLSKYSKFIPEDKFKNYFNNFINDCAREGFNFLIQGLCADVMKLALVFMHQEWQKHDFDFSEGVIAVVHDEILAEVKEEHTELARAIIEDSMLRSARMFLKKVPAYVNIDIGRNWAECH